MQKEKPPFQVIPNWPQSRLARQTGMNLKIGVALDQMLLLFRKPSSNRRHRHLRYRHLRRRLPPPPPRSLGLPELSSAEVSPPNQLERFQPSPPTSLPPSAPEPSQ